MADTTRPRMWVLHAASHALMDMIELPAPAESRAAVAVAETTRVVRAIEHLAKARLKWKCLARQIASQQRHQKQQNDDNQRSGNRIQDQIANHGAGIIVWLHGAYPRTAAGSA